MAIKLTTYFFGRLNIVSSAESYDEKKKLIVDSLRSSTSVVHHQHKYMFLDVGVAVDQGVEYLFGNLVKYRDEDEEVVDEVNATTEEIVVPKLIIAKARFYIQDKTWVIAYRRSGSDINERAFREAFAKLLDEYYQAFFFKSEIRVISDDRDVVEAIDTFVRVDRIRIKLHPSNPNSSRLWESVDERMQEMNIAEMTQEVEAQPGGLKKLELEDLKAKMVMAADGYGHGLVEGLDRNTVPRTVTTDDDPIQVRAPSEHGRAIDLSEGPGALNRAVLGALRNVFNTIKSRIADRN